MINHGQAFSRMGSGPIKSSTCLRPESLALSAGYSWLFLAIPASITAIVVGGTLQIDFHENIAMQIYKYLAIKPLKKTRRGLLRW